MPSSRIVSVTARWITSEKVMQGDRGFTAIYIAAQHFKGKAATNPYSDVNWVIEISQISKKTICILKDPSTCLRIYLVYSCATPKC